MDKIGWINRIVVASKDHMKIFIFFIQPSLACLSSQLVKIQSQEHNPTPPPKKTAPALQAMIDSIKSNSATVVHFKVNLSQHFDIFF